MKKSSLQHIVIAALICLQGFFAAAAAAQTTETTGPELGSSTPKISNPIANPKLSVSLPGFVGFRSAVCDETGCSVPWLADYIKALFQYGIAIIGILAVIVMMIAGVMWLTAAGNDERIHQARDMIRGSLLGVLVAVSSYMILTIINPALTELSPLNVKYIKEEDLLSIETLNETMTDNVIGNTIQSKGQKCFFDTFGHSESEVRSKLVSINLFGKNVQVHQLAKAAFDKVQAELNGKLGGYKFDYVGTFSWRANVNNPSVMSTHSFGVTVDLNPDDNPNYKSKAKPCTTNFPPILIQTFKNNGFRWGGDYKSVCDAMHFEWLGPCQK